MNNFSIRLWQPICSHRILRDLTTLLRATCGKALAAQDRPTARRLERHRIGLPTLVAGDLETLAFAARAPAASAKVCAAGVAASFATLRLAQVSLCIVFLLALCERERRTALCTGNLYVWHFCFSLRKAARGMRLSLLSKGMALAHLILL